MKRFRLAPLAVAAFSLPAAAGQLLDLHARAVDTDPGFAADRAQAQAQRAQAGLRRSEILPQLGAQASYGRQRDETEASSTVVLEGDTVTYANTLSWAVQLSQPPFDATAFARYAQVDEQLALALATESIAAQDLILRVSEVYFEWLAAHNGLRLAKAELAAIERSLEQAEVRFEVGLAAITDKQEAQARYDLARSQELSAAAQLRSRTQALRTVAGYAPERPERIGDNALENPPLPGDPGPWAERAVANNLSLLSAQTRAEIADQERRAARGAYWPRLELQAQHLYQDNTEAQFGREFSSSQATLQLEVPLFTGGATRARHQEAVAQAEAAQAEAERTRLQVEQAALDAYDGVVTGLAQVRALTQAVRSATTARDAVEAGVEVGTRTSVDLLDAQRELFRARNDLAQARYTYLLNVLQLERSVGDLDREDLARIDKLLVPIPAGAETDIDG